MPKKTTPAQRAPRQETKDQYVRPGGMPSGKLPAMRSVKEVHPARAHFGVALSPLNPNTPLRRTGYGNIAGTYDTGNPIVVETNFFDRKEGAIHFDLHLELKSLRPRIGLKTLKGQKADLLEQLKTLRTRLNAMIAMGERELAETSKKKAPAPKPIPHNDSPAIGFARLYIQSLEDQDVKRKARAAKAKARRDAKKAANHEPPAA